MDRIPHAILIWNQEINKKIRRGDMDPHLSHNLDDRKCELPKAYKRDSTCMALRTAYATCNDDLCRLERPEHSKMPSEMWIATFQRCLKLSIVTSLAPFLREAAYRARFSKRSLRSLESHTSWAGRIHFLFEWCKFHGNNSVGYTYEILSKVLFLEEY